MLPLLRCCLSASTHWESTMPSPCFLSRRYGSFTTGCTSAEFSAECHNANGYGAYSSFLTVQSNVAKLSDQQLPVYISEMNCYTNAQSNSKSPYFDQVHTFDQAQTAACVGAMITSLINKASSMRRCFAQCSA